MKRTVKRSLYGNEVVMAGIKVKQPFPTAQVEQIDPFLLLHHFKDVLPNDRDIKHLGVGPHPHRGFSPVTFIYEGGIYHQDSLGNKSEIYQGGVQWLNAGRGVIHSERPSKNIAEYGFKQEIVQLWINTPSVKKMNPAKYFGYQENEIPKLDLGVGIDAKLISGNFNEQKGVIDSDIPLLILQVEMQKDAEITIPLPTEFNTVVYQLDGELFFQGFGFQRGSYATEFNNDGKEISIKAIEKTRFLVLGGKPINEPLAHFGPYVMNNQTEILEAIRDFNMGKFGFLVED